MKRFGGFLLEFVYINHNACPFLSDCPHVNNSIYWKTFHVIVYCIDFFKICSDCPLLWQRMDVLWEELLLFFNLGSEVQRCNGRLYYFQTFSFEPGNWWIYIIFLLEYDVPNNFDIIVKRIFSRFFMLKTAFCSDDYNSPA